MVRCHFNGCGHIILGRSWLYKLDVTIYGRSYSCSFTLNPLQLKPTTKGNKQEEG